MGRLARSGAGLVAVAAIAAWFITRPTPLDSTVAQGHIADSAAGKLVFHAAGCASCHTGPEATEDDGLVLQGGQSFATDFGTFYAPNISSDPVEGIGAWTLPQFARAVRAGVSPDGQHYYPAFPYSAYQHMTDADVADLWAYMQSLPKSVAPSRAHDVSFPFSIRRSLGGWKLLFMPKGYTVAGSLSDEEARGRYLAEALGHCAECHTERNALGGLRRSAWLAGAPNPSGKGRIPNITPGALDWSKADLVAYFTTGLTPEYDSAGGEMAEVVSNLSNLPEADREALAAYLKRVPAHP